MQSKLRAIDALRYWIGIAECECSDPLPNGGCLKCDLEGILKIIKQNMKIRTTQLTITPENESIYHERATNISVQDEGGGEFIAITQDGQEVTFDVEEWPHIVEAVERIIAEMKENNTENP